MPFDVFLTCSFIIRKGDRLVKLSSERLRYGTGVFNAPYDPFGIPLNECCFYFTRSHRRLIFAYRDKASFRLLSNDSASAKRQTVGDYADVMLL